MTAIEKGTRPEPGFADGRAALALAEAAAALAEAAAALAEAAAESLRTGRTVRPAAEPR